MGKCCLHANLFIFDQIIIKVAGNQDRRKSCHVRFWAESDHSFCSCEWLDWAMVLGSFQCWGVLILWHIVGQGPAVVAAGAGWVGCFLFLFFLSRLSYLPFFRTCFSVGDLGMQVSVRLSVRQHLPCVSCERNSSYSFLPIFLKLCICFLHGVRMCMWFGYNC